MYRFYIRILAIVVVTAVILGGGTSSLLAVVYDTSRNAPVTDPELDQFRKEHWLRLMRVQKALSEMKMTDAQAQYNVSYYDLNLIIDTDTLHQSIDGAVTVVAAITAPPLLNFELDFSDSMTVDSVSGLSGTMQFTHQSDIISVALPAQMQSGEVSLTVYYHGRPFPLGFGSFMFCTNPHGDPLVSTLSEPFFARTWWPCKDQLGDKADSVDVRVTMDDYYTVVSNGLLVSATDNGDGTRTTHWHESYPIVTYLVSLACADYNHQTQHFNYDGYNMPVEFYMYPADWKKYMTYNNKVVPLLEFYSETFGTYPFIEEKYGHAQTSGSRGVAMEHQTCSSMGFFNEKVVAHELAHQWWGDMITCSSWNDIWLNEGFATYSEALWQEHVGGMDAYHRHINGLSFMEGQVYVEDASSVPIIFSRTVYYKGAFILHMLRRKLGNELFFEMLKEYGRSVHVHGFATTEDFQHVVEQVSGNDLTQFFQQWIFQPSYPDYRIAFYPIETDSGFLTHLHLEQRQTHYAPYIVEVDILFQFADTFEIITVDNYLKSQNYQFLFDQMPQSVILDPDNWLIESRGYEDYSLRIIDNELPQALSGISYQYQLNALAGVEPYTWAVIDTPLPDGVILSQEGLIGGIASTAGEYPVTIQVTDHDNPPLSFQQQYLLTVANAHGDLNEDQTLSLNDVLLLIRYLYRDEPLTAPAQFADVNCDGRCDLLDIMTLLNYLYSIGPPPCGSFP